MADIKLLEKLCNESGVSGDEGRIRDIIISEIKPYADKITVDIMGNVIAYKKGADSTKKIMLDAHMDEVGLIVSDITESGYLKFKTVGSIDLRVIVGKRVRIKGLKGVIALKAVHLQTKAERENAPDTDALYIDIGAKDKRDAKKYVSAGDYACFDTKFAPFGNGFYKAKALDNRIGCAILAEVIKTDCAYDTYFCFTVQEEVGCRGAAVCANRIKPYAALIVEATTCGFVSGAEKHMYVTTPGEGGAISVMDNGSYSDIELTRNLYKLASEEGIKLQYKRTTSGGNDARVIQSGAGGAKTCVVSVPCRYIHSPVATAAGCDIEAAMEAAKLFTKRVKELVV